MTRKLNILCGLAVLALLTLEDHTAWTAPVGAPAPSDEERR